MSTHLDRYRRGNIYLMLCSNGCRRGSLRRVTPLEERWQRRQRLLYRCRCRALATLGHSTGETLYSRTPHTTGLHSQPVSTTICPPRMLANRSAKSSSSSCCHQSAPQPRMDMTTQPAAFAAVLCGFAPLPPRFVPEGVPDPRS